MNPLKVIVVFLLILSLTPTFASGTATVHGAVYEWNSLELLDDAIVEVNSTPAQRIVAKYGIYSFDLAEGTYKVNAYYYSGNTLEYSTEEIITISDDGDYIVDLLLYPTYESPFEEYIEDDITSSIEEGTGIIEEGDEFPVYLYYLPIILILLIIVIYAIRKKENKLISETGRLKTVFTDEESFPKEEFVKEVTSNEKNEDKELPEDLEKIVEIIKSNGGRITQKELRQKVDYSEAKVSLMIADLENRGIIRKFKKGRGNIIILS
ncbi:winged helix-turn-helix transcriptional regulator [Methanohalophilus sp.]|uniref:helix-turn-helix transcriptional regulator n=1 Tax=Methanohalophilus sp. TaxID=1966352 RepID=UPI0026135C09|nr:winged helix-turn-helix transcriptional regulator [Methanohalophilus sp.]MDK2892126.1 hypothetical protein [Methanohalophilus sp.]